jgi:NitT/TauT family transport system substrate-binding protein
MVEEDPTCKRTAGAVTKGATVKQLTIGYLSTMYHTSHLIKASGWVEQEIGVPSCWKLFPTGPAMVEAFSGRTIDIGYIGLPPAMIGMERGVPITCIAGGHIEGTVLIGKNNFISFNDLKDLVKVLEQFNGHRLGTPTRGSIHDVIIRNLIGEKETSVEVKNYSWADLIPEAIDRGEVSGAVGTPPLAVISRMECATKIIIPPDNLWPYNPSYGIVVRKELFEEKGILEDFCNLHEKASNLIREQPEEAASIVSSEIKVVDRDFVIQAFGISPKYCSSLPQSYRDSTMRFVPVLSTLGYITKPLSEEAVFDLTIIENTHPQPEHYSDPARIPPYRD